MNNNLTFKKMKFKLNKNSSRLMPHAKACVSPQQSQPILTNEIGRS